MEENTAQYKKIVMNTFALGYYNMLSLEIVIYFLKIKQHSNLTLYMSLSLIYMLWQRQQNIILFSCISISKAGRCEIVGLPLVNFR